MSTPNDRLKIAASILNFEARRDGNGHLKVYSLPAGDGGGKYEVAGINERFHPVEAAHLRDLVEDGRFDEAERYAQEYIASYTDTADRWTDHTAVESYLRDCVFNRGAGGAAKIYQIALGVKVDGGVGPITMGEAEKVEPASFLPHLREARERYEREWVGRDEGSIFWKGLVNRWNNALAFAQGFLGANGGGEGTLGGGGGALHAPHGSAPDEVAMAFAEREKLGSDCNWIFEVDYSINSRKPRLFVYSIKDATLYKYKCAHGVGGENFSPHDGVCREVSNVPNSKCSSLGVIRTAENYDSDVVGEAVRLHGLSPTNSKILDRGVVLHGGAYVSDNASNSDDSISGRSHGCIVVDDRYIDPQTGGELIEWLKGGSIGVAHYGGKFAI